MSRDQLPWFASESFPPRALDGKISGKVIALFAVMLILILGLMPINMIGLSDLSVLYYSYGVDMVLSLIAAYLCYNAGKDLPSISPLRWVWWWVGLACFAWFIADGISLWYPMTHKLVPVCLFIAIVKINKALELTAPLWGDMVAMFIGSMLAMVAIYSGWEGFFDDDIFLVLVSIGYAVFDVVLISMAIRVWSSFQGSELERPFRYIIMGIACYFASNQIYNLMALSEDSEGYISGSYVDVGWMLAFFLISLAAITMKKLFNLPTDRLFKDA